MRVHIQHTQTHLKVDELSFDYTQCPSAPRSLTPPSSGDNNGLIEKWSYDQNSNTCTIEFRVEKTLIAPVFLYYRLTNFYQNHRRYVRSYSAAQLSGSALSVDSLTDCAPLDVNPSRVPYYPCGLIANSMFNGMFTIDICEIYMLYIIIYIIYIL